MAGQVNSLWLPPAQPLSDVKLKAKGPDAFHIRMDGEQRFVSETDVEYLGQCTYLHSFRLATAAPFNMTILWAFEVRHLCNFCPFSSGTDTVGCRIIVQHSRPPFSLSSTTRRARYSPDLI